MRSCCSRLCLTVLQAQFQFRVIKLGINDRQRGDVGVQNMTGKQFFFFRLKPAQPSTTSPRLCVIVAASGFFSRFIRGRVSHSRSSNQKDPLSAHLPGFIVQHQTAHTVEPAQLEHGWHRCRASRQLWTSWYLFQRVATWGGGEASLKVSFCGRIPVGIERGAGFSVLQIWHSTVSTTGMGVPLLPVLRLL